MCNKMKSPKNTKNPDTVGCRGRGIGWGGITAARWPVADGEVYRKRNRPAE